MTRLRTIDARRVDLSITETRSPRGWLGNQSTSMAGEDLPGDLWWGADEPKTGETA